MAEVKTKFVGVKLSTSLNQKIEALAEAEGNCVSAIIRRLLTVAVERETRQEP